MELKCYLVGEYDYVAAYTPQQAREIVFEMTGDEVYLDTNWIEVEEVLENVLNLPWCDEDDSSVIVGTLKQWMAESIEPVYLVGTE